MKSISFPKFLLPLLLLTALSGCVTNSPKIIYTEDELVAILQKRMIDENVSKTMVPFYITVEIKEYAREVAGPYYYEKGKVNALVRAIIDRKKLDVKYNEYKALNAIEVFVEGEANCIAYTNLFIGMARSVGLPVYYVDVTEVSKLKREGELVVNSGHICAGIEINGKITLIDFAEHPRIGYKFYKVIDDLEALANFINSQGVLYSNQVDLSVEDLDSQIDMKLYRTAIRVKPTFAKAYNNLGIAYQRRRLYDLAIVQYKRAIVLDSKLSAPYSNLGNVYYLKGEYNKAIEYLKKALKIKKNNPYTHYAIGLVYYYKKDYPEAIKHFRRSARLNREYAEPHNLLGMVYFQQGKYEEAILEAQKALQIDPHFTQAKSNLKKYQDMYNKKISSSAKLIK
ncbi:MAG: tetratricopeptide repeat protein [Acidobacteriota bacterium]